MSKPNLHEDPVIEGFRGLAALLVLATHYAHLITDPGEDWGFASTGVDLFFVLSGFVFAPYLAGKILYYPAHLVRRVLRLYPLYLCALALYVALKPAETAFDHVASHLTMTHTLQSLEIASFYNPAFWSLPPEMEFYIALPALVFAAQYVGIFGLVLAAILGKLALVALADPMATGLTYRAIAMVHLPGLLAEFMLGCAAYRLSQEVSIRQRSVLLFLAIFGLLAAFQLFAHFINAGQASVGSLHFWVAGNMGLLAAMAYMLLVSGLAGMRIKNHAVLNVFLWAGRLSYGIYLFHNAVGQIVAQNAPQLHGWAAWIVQLLCTLLLSTLLHLVVEAPARKVGRQLAIRLQNRTAKISGPN
jgi:peptidoglycan/LPS O-acetylase OafA/YrhL